MCLVSSHRAVKPGVPPSETWSTQLVMPAQAAPGECRRKYKAWATMYSSESPSMTATYQQKIEDVNTFTPWTTGEEE